jgi:hypothetical protein
LDRLQLQNPLLLAVVMRPREPFFHRGKRIRITDHMPWNLAEL